MDIGPSWDVPHKIGRVLPREVKYSSKKSIFCLPQLDMATLGTEGFSKSWIINAYGVVAFPCSKFGIYCGKHK